jgi:hypothetical protein
LRTIRVERWPLDTGARIDELPPTVRAVHRQAGKDWMVLANTDGSLTISPLPTAGHDRT